MSVQLSTRILVSLSVVLLMGTLVACSSTGSRTAVKETAVADNHASDNLAAGAMTAEENRAEPGNANAGLPFEVGQWDASDPNFRFFDPCAEIPADVFAEVGLGEMEGDFLYEEGRYSNCYFSISNTDDYFPNVEITIFSDIISEDRYGSVGLKILSEHGQGGIYLMDDRGDCSTSMDTDRGRWGVQVSYGVIDSDRDGCDIALSIHNSIIERLAG